MVSALWRCGGDLPEGPSRRHSISDSPPNRQRGTAIPRFGCANSRAMAGALGERRFKSGIKSRFNVIRREIREPVVASPVNRHAIRGDTCVGADNIHLAKVISPLVNAGRRPRSDTASPAPDARRCYRNRASATTESGAPGFAWSRTVAPQTRVGAFEGRIGVNSSTARIIVSRSPAELVAPPRARPSSVILGDFVGTAGRCRAVMRNPRSRVAALK